MRQQLERTITGDETITVPALEEISELQNWEQIAALAYALWQARGRPDGTPDDDWFRAEREIVGSNRIDEEVELRDFGERSIGGETADPSLLRFPVGSEVSQAAHAGASRRVDGQITLRPFLDATLSHETATQRAYTAPGIRRAR